MSTALGIFQVQKLYKNSCIAFCTYYMPVEAHWMLGSTHLNFTVPRPLHLGIVAIALMGFRYFFKAYNGFELAATEVAPSFHTAPVCRNERDAAGVA